MKAKKGIRGNLDSIRISGFWITVDDGMGSGLDR
jgi:hypothetical protein